MPPVPSIDEDDSTTVICAMYEKSRKVLTVEQYRKLKIVKYYNARGTKYGRCLDLFNNMVIDECM